MALKPKIARLEDVAEGLRAAYIKNPDGDGYIADVEGMVLREKLDEFRENNLKLEREKRDIEANMAKYKDVDLEKYRSYEEKLRKLDEKKLIDAGKFDELYEARVGPLKTDHENQIKVKDDLIAKERAEKEKVIQDRDSRAIESEIHAIANSGEIGRFKENSLDVVTKLIQGECAVVNGKVVGVKMDDKGERVTVFGTDGNPKTVKQYMQELTKTKPFLLENSSGGGVRPGSEHARGNGSGRTMRRSEFDQLTPTAQMNYTTVEKGAVID